MFPQRLTVTNPPCKYELTLEETGLIITATHIKEYFEWTSEKICDGICNQNLLPPEIIFDMFRDYNIHQLDGNAKINFPIDCGRHNDRIYIKITNTILLYKTTVEKSTLITLHSHILPQIIRIEKIMADVYDESYAKFKQDLIVNLGKVDFDSYDDIFEIIKWFCTMEINDKIIDRAASDGHLKIVKWLYKNKIKCTPSTIICAARNGHLDIVKWLHPYSDKVSLDRTIKAAEESQQFEIMRWFHRIHPEEFISSVAVLPWYYTKLCEQAEDVD
jgi:hypothetical protein